MKTIATQDRDSKRKKLLLDAALCFSMANLLFLPIWSELIFSNPIQSHYYMLGVPATSDYLAVAFNVFLSGFLLLGLLYFAEREPNAG